MPDSSEDGRFDFNTRLGLVIICEAAVVSTIAVTGILAYIAYSAIPDHDKGRRHWSTATHVHWYFISLLVSELIQAIGGVMSIKMGLLGGHLLWFILHSTGSVQANGRCRGRTRAIAIHTFSIIVFKWTPPSSPHLAWLVIAFIWVFLALIVGINAGVNRDFYGDTGYWCWITSAYPVQRIAVEYFWMWFASLLNIVLYVGIALVVKGYIVVIGWKVRIPSKEDRTHMRLSSVPGAKNSNGLALQMLFYPAVYTVTVLPIAIVRWSAFYGTGNVPFWATVLSDTVFASSGLFNVILFAITRPTLVPNRQSQFRISQYSSTLTPTGDASSRNRPRYSHSSDPIDEWEVAARTSPISIVTGAGPEKYSIRAHTPSSPSRAHIR